MESINSNFQRGVAFAKIHNYPNALKAFTASIQEYPNKFTSYLNRGSIECCLGLDEFAIEDFNKVIQLQPYQITGYYNRFISNYKIGRKLQAQHDLYIALALAYMKKGDQLKNFNLINKSIQIVQNNSMAFIKRGMLYKQQGNIEMAIIDCTKALQYDDKNIYALHLKISLCHKINQEQQVQQDIQKITQISNTKQSNIITLTPLRSLFQTPSQIQIDIQQKIIQFTNLRNKLFKKPNHISTQQTHIYKVQNQNKLQTTIAQKTNAYQTFEKRNIAVNHSQNYVNTSNEILVTKSIDIREQQSLNNTDNAPQNQIVQNVEKQYQIQQQPSKYVEKQVSSQIINLPKYDNYGKQEQQLSHQGYYVSVDKVQESEQQQQQQRKDQTLNNQQLLNNNSNSQISKQQFQQSNQSQHNNNHHIHSQESNYQIVTISHDNHNSLDSQKDNTHIQQKKQQQSDIKYETLEIKQNEHNHIIFKKQDNKNNIDNTQEQLQCKQTYYQHKQKILQQKQKCQFQNEQNNVIKEQNNIIQKIQNCKQQQKQKQQSEIKSIVEDNTWRIQKLLLERQDIIGDQYKQEGSRVNEERNQIIKLKYRQQQEQNKKQVKQHTIENIQQQFNQQYQQSQNKQQKQQQKQRQQQKQEQDIIVDDVYQSKNSQIQNSQDLINDHQPNKQKKQSQQNILQNDYNSQNDHNQQKQQYQINQQNQHQQQHQYDQKQNKQQSMQQCNNQIISNIAQQLQQLNISQQKPIQVQQGEDHKQQQIPYQKQYNIIGQEQQKETNILKQQSNNQQQVSNHIIQQNQNQLQELIHKQTLQIQQQEQEQDQRNKIKQQIHYSYHQNIQQKQDQLNQQKLQQNQQNYDQLNEQKQEQINNQNEQNIKNKQQIIVTVKLENQEQLFNNNNNNKYQIEVQDISLQQTQNKDQQYLQYQNIIDQYQQKIQDQQQIEQQSINAKVQDFNLLSLSDSRSNNNQILQQQVQQQQQIINNNHLGDSDEITIQTRNNTFLKPQYRTQIQQIQSFELVNSKISSQINTDRNESLLLKDVYAVRQEVKYQINNQESGYSGHQQEKEIEKEKEIENEKNEQNNEQKKQLFSAQDIKEQIKQARLVQSKAYSDNDKLEQYQNQLKKNISSNIRRLQIFIQSATLTRNTQWLGKMSPFVEIKYNGWQIRTKVQERAGMKPEWNQLCKFNFDQDCEDIVFSVFDKQTFKNDDIVASNAFKISQIIGFQTLPIYFQNEDAGILNISVQIKQ